MPAPSRTRKREGKAPGRNHLIASAAGTLEVLEFIGSTGGPVQLMTVVEATGNMQCQQCLRGYRARMGHLYAVEEPPRTGPSGRPARCCPSTSRSGASAGLGAGR